jgi:hypothetical protein
MKKHVNLVAVVMFLIAVASLAAALKIGHGSGKVYGFSSGG